MLDPTAKKLELLKERIARSNGKVIVLVHPHYTPDADVAYYRAVQKTVRQSRTPVVILEERARMHEMGGFVAGLGGKALILPTRMGSPFLDIHNNPDAYLTKILQTTNAKKVYLGGQLSELNEHGEVTLGCVGYTREELMRGNLIPKLLPTLLYPEKPASKRTRAQAVIRRIKAMRHKPLRAMKKIGLTLRSLFRH